MLKLKVVHLGKLPWASPAIPVKNYNKLELLHKQSIMLDLDNSWTMLMSTAFSYRRQLEEHDPIWKYIH